MPVRIVGAILTSEILTNDYAALIGAIVERYVIRVDPGIKHGDADAVSVEHPRNWTAAGADVFSAGGHRQVPQRSHLLINGNVADVIPLRERQCGISGKRDNAVTEIVEVTQAAVTGASEKQIRATIPVQRSAGQSLHQVRAMSIPGSRDQLG